MLRLSLNGQWVMRKSTNKVPDKEGQNTAECISKGVQGRIPGSVYSFLLGAGLMEDPYYRDRELDALRLMEEDYTFSRIFIVAPSLGILTGEHQCLRFEGIDTLSEVCLNGVLLGQTDNMHITWEFDVRGILREGKNTLEVTILSPIRFIRHADREYHLGGSYESIRGFPHLRKAHCMFGWDWGPNGLGAQPLYEVEASLLKPLPQRSRETAAPKPLPQRSRETAAPEVTPMSPGRLVFWRQELSLI